jgi:hypothetical protein
MESNDQDIREMIEQIRIELSVMQQLWNRVDKDLFGNHQPGILDQMKKRIDKHDRLLWIVIGATAAMSFLSGSGTISLKTLLGH